MSRTHSRYASFLAAALLGGCLLGAPAFAASCGGGVTSMSQAEIFKIKMAAIKREMEKTNTSINGDAARACNNIMGTIHDAINSIRIGKFDFKSIDYGKVASTVLNRMGITGLDPDSICKFVYKQTVGTINSQLADYAKYEDPMELAKLGYDVATNGTTVLVAMGQQTLSLGGSVVSPGAIANNLGNLGGSLGRATDITGGLLY